MNTPTTASQCLLPRSRETEIWANLLLLLQMKTVSKLSWLVIWHFLDDVYVKVLQQTLIRGHLTFCTMLIWEKCLFTFPQSFLFCDSHWNSLGLSFYWNQSSCLYFLKRFNDWRCDQPIINVYLGQRDEAWYASETPDQNLKVLIRNKNLSDLRANSTGIFKEQLVQILLKLCSNCIRFLTNILAVFTKGTLHLIISSTNFARNSLGKILLIL